MSYIQHFYLIRKVNIFFEIKNIFYHFNYFFLLKVVFYSKFYIFCFNSRNDFKGIKRVIKANNKAKIEDKNKSINGLKERIFEKI